MERCPLCRGRINEDAECKRCGAELTLLMDVNAAAEKKTLEALLLMTKKEYTQAEVLLCDSQSLVFSSFNQEILGFVRAKITDDISG